MIAWALVFAADMAAGFTDLPKNLRRKEMVGDLRGEMVESVSLVLGREGASMDQSTTCYRLSSPQSEMTPSGSSGQVSSTSDRQI